MDTTIFVSYKLVMIRINIHEAKTHLSAYLSKLKEGDVILLCKHNTPVAEIRGLAKARKGSRPLGLARGKVRIHRKFFDALPEEIVDAFEGRRK